jgi:hypothetical protein
MNQYFNDAPAEGLLLANFSLTFQFQIDGEMKRECSTEHITGKPGKESIVKQTAYRRRDFSGGCTISREAGAHYRNCLGYCDSHIDYLSVRL